MKVISMILAMFLVASQRLPNTLQVAQIEGTRAPVSTIIVPGQAPVVTNRPQLPAPQLEQEQQAPVLTSRFDVEFVPVNGMDADLRSALTTLAEGHDLNLVMPPDINGTVRITLNNVTLEEALDAILTPRGLQYRIEGNMLRVDRLQMETRNFTFDYIQTQRTVSRSVSASSSAGGGGGGGGAGGGVGGGGGSSSSVSGTESTNLFVDLEAGVRSFLTGATGVSAPAPAAGTTQPVTSAPGVGRAVFNRMAGLITVTDYPQVLDQIAFYLDTVENIVQRQVVIEAKFVEVRLDEGSQQGINWTAVLGNALRLEQNLGIQGPFQISVTNSDFNAVLSLLRTQGTVNVLSAPTIATLNNQPAVMRVGTQDVFFTTTTQVDPRTGTVVQTAETPVSIQEGIVLDVTPQISEDGIISMNIHPAITERTGQVQSPSGSVVPIVDVRETDTVVRVQEGATVLIGGLISDRVLRNINKVPVLGDLPLFGNLFRRETTENRKTDLVILITPRILNVLTAVDYARNRIEEQERKRTELPQD